MPARPMMRKDVKQLPLKSRVALARKPLTPQRRPVMIRSKAPAGPIARWFQKRVELGVMTAAMKAEKASAKPRYQKIIFNPKQRTAVAGKPQRVGPRKKAA